MKLTDEYYKAREDAIKWLNGKRDFDRGAKILIQSGYKPHVAAKISKWGNTPHAEEKLLHEIRMMIRVWGDPEAVEHEDEDEMEKSDETGLLDFIAQTGSESDTEVLKNARINCAEMFRERGVLRNQLIEIGESNDEKSIESRKELIQQIKNLSDKIDTLYQTVANGEPGNTEKEPGEDPKPTKEELLRIKSNIKSKLTRARNMLEYQQEKKAEKPNQMPEGANRKKYENKIIRLENDLESIDLQLADFV